MSKKASFIYMIITVCAIVLLGCDKIPLDEINQQEAEFVSTGKTVLLEYYTGHKCGNCPDGAGKLLPDLKANYGDDLIIMSIHAGFFASTSEEGKPFSYDFKSEAGNELDSKFGVTNTGTPKGMIERKAFNNSKILNPTQWNSAIAEHISDSASIAISLALSFNPESRLISGNVEVSYNTAIAEQLELEVYITEDSVVNWQKNYNLEPENIPNYVHRFVLREQVNVGGGVIESSEALQGAAATRDISTVLKDEYVWQQCQVVAVVRSKSSDEVFQSAAFSLRSLE